MKKLLIPFAFVIFCACGGPTHENSSTRDTTHDETKEIAENQEEIQPKKALHYAIGQWRADPSDAGVEILLNINEDGSYNQNVGGTQQEGTWEKVYDDQIQVFNTGLSEKGQTWKIVSRENGELHLVFSTSKGFSEKPIIFKVLE